MGKSPESPVVCLKVMKTENSRETETVFGRESLGSQVKINEYIQSVGVF